jgi:hypothetical protein
MFRLCAGQGRLLAPQGNASRLPVLPDMISKRARIVYVVASDTGVIVADPGSILWVLNVRRDPRKKRLRNV